MPDDRDDEPFTTDRPTIYTLGYGAGWSDAEIREAIARTRGLLVDIRYKPTSRDPRWRRARLERTFDLHYLHLREFGNENYKGGPVKLVAPELGVEKIRNFLGRGLHPILMCACKTARHCHRRDAGELVAERLHARLVHLEPQAFRDPGPLLA